MIKTIVSDTSPVNYLILIGEIELLPSLFGQILLPPAVLEELTHPLSPLPVSQWATQLPPWIEVRTPNQSIVFSGLHRGEAEAIALAQKEGSLLLIDERQGRNLAKNRGVDVLGTIGILEIAAQRGMIDLLSTIQRLQTTSFQVSASIIQNVLKRNANSQNGEN